MVSTSLEERRLAVALKRLARLGLEKADLMERVTLRYRVRWSRNRSRSGQGQSPIVACPHTPQNGFR
jgi:hypothetical protein